MSDIEELEDGEDLFVKLFGALTACFDISSKPTTGHVMRVFFYHMNSLKKHSIQTSARATTRVLISHWLNLNCETLCETAVVSRLKAVYKTYDNLGVQAQGYNAPPSPLQVPRHG